MKTIKVLIGSSLLGLVLACATPGQAAPVIGTSTSTTLDPVGSTVSTFPVITTNDLVLTGASTLSSVAQTSGSALFGSSLGGLNDGTIYAGTTNIGGTVGIEAFLPSNGSVVTFTLNTSVNTLGYDITQIQSLTAETGGGRQLQSYTVSYETVGGLTFIPLATVTNQGTTVNQPEEVQVLIGNGAGGTATTLMATDVGALQFTFANAAGEDGYREISIIGDPTAAPEPSSMALIGLGALVLLVVSRSRSRCRQQGE